MHKSMRKHGITAHKFMIEIHMTKVELKLAHQCRISVIFKRGEHKKETVNAPVLDKGIAIFDEKLAVPSIFYFDEAKNAFVSKEATLALNMISSKAQRLMGVTKFDLSVYLNNNMKDTNVDLKMDKCFDKSAKFYFRLKMTQLSELDPCMSFKEDEETSQITNDHSRQSPSRIYFAEKHPDLSQAILADNSDIGDGRSLSPRPESMDSLNEKEKSPNTAHRKILPKGELSRSIDDKAKKGTKTAPNSSRDKVSPRQAKEDNIQKSKTTQQKGGPVHNQKKEHLVEETPRFQNDQRRPASPFDQTKVSRNSPSKFSPHSDEIEEIRKSPTPTGLGEVRHFNEGALTGSKSVDDLRIGNKKGITKKFADSPLTNQGYQKKELEDEGQGLDSDSTEQYQAYEKAVREERTQEESQEEGTKTNKMSKWQEKAVRDQKKWEGSERVDNETNDDHTSQDKYARDYKSQEENRELQSESRDKYKKTYEGAREISAEVTDKAQSYEKPVKAQRINEEELRIDDESNERERSNEKIINKQKLREEERGLNDVSTDREKSYEKLAKELKEQLGHSHEEYLELSKRYEELKQTHNMLLIDYQTLQKGNVNDRKSEKRTDFELSIYKEKVIGLQRELVEQKAENENLVKRFKFMEAQRSQESKQGQESSLDSDASDPRQLIYDTQNQDYLQTKQYEDTIRELREELDLLRSKYEEKQAQNQPSKFNFINSSNNERQNASQSQNYSQLSQQLQHQSQSGINRELDKSQITISELTNGINKLRKENEQKDTKIENLEGHIKELEEEVQFMKLQEERSKIQSLDLSDHSLEKINFDPKGSNETPENLQKTIQELMVQNLGLKKEVDQLKRILSLNQLDQNKQQEEMVALSRKNASEEEFEKKIAQLNTENARLTGELKKAKMGWAAADIEKYNSVTAAKESQEKVRKSEERVDVCEIEIFKLKSRLAELVNSIMEFGGDELLDKVEEIVSLDKSSKLSFKEDLKKTVLK